MNIVEITESKVLTKKNTFLVCNSSQPVIVTLTATTKSGGGHYIKNIGSGTATVTPHEGDTIDGAATIVLAQYDCIFIMDYAVGNWIIVSTTQDE
jgi:hypothetical protein